MNDFDVNTLIDVYSGQRSYELIGFIDGNFFGSLSVFNTEDEAYKAGERWAQIDHSDNLIEFAQGQSGE